MSTKLADPPISSPSLNLAASMNTAVVEDSAIQDSAVEDSTLYVGVKLSFDRIVLIPSHQIVEIIRLSPTDITPIPQEFTLGEAKYFGLLMVLHFSVKFLCAIVTFGDRVTTFSSFRKAGNTLALWFRISEILGNDRAFVRQIRIETPLIPALTQR